MNESGLGGLEIRWVPMFSCLKKNTPPLKEMEFWVDEFAEYPSGAFDTESDRFWVWHPPPDAIVTTRIITYYILAWEIPINTITIKPSFPIVTGGPHKRDMLLSRCLYALLVVSTPSIFISK